MSVRGRHLLVLSSGSTVLALLALWPCLLLAVADDSLTRTNPLVALRPALVLRSAVILSAPLVLALGAAGGAALYQARLDAESGSLALQLSGASGWLVLRWGLVPAALAGAASLALLASAHPRAAAGMRGMAWLEERDLPAMLARVHALEDNDRLSYRGTPRDDGSIADFRLLFGRGDQALGLAADRARLRLAGGDRLRLELEGGWACHRRHLPEGVRFEEGELELALGAVSGLRTHGWAPPAERTLRDLAADAEFAAGVASPRAQRARARYRFEPWHRLVLGLLPVIAAAQVLWSLAPLSPIVRSPAHALAAFLGVALLDAWLLSTARGLAEHALPSALALLACVPLAPALVLRGLLALGSRSA